MAAELVAGALLSSFLSVWFDRLASGQVKDFIRGQKTTQGLLKKLEIKLLSVNKVLDDAEEQQIRDPTVRKWLDELKDVVYAAGDVLDEINVEALRRKLEDDQSGSGSTCCKVPKFNYSTWFDKFERSLEPRIVEILERLEFIVDQKDVLGLKQGVQVRQQARILRETTSLADDSDVFGRDEDKETIITLLLSDDATEDKVGVVPIVGMGGIGKTTLAQIVYNDARVKEEFDLRAWVCVSDDFDVLRITQAVYASITSETCAITELDLLQVKLKEALARKKFLIVLDDVWNENYSDWDRLRRPFGFGACGSKILVTTRNEAVAAVMGTLPIYHLRHISEEDGWLLFAKHAFKNAYALITEHPDLANIGRKIVKKCNGLPLAAKSLGGLLRSELNMEEWEKVLESEIWEFSESESNILPALWLSYHYLPSHLKSCFACCSIFPKDYNFTKSELVLLWLAEDLLQPKKNKVVEDVGEDYFNNLVSRSFFQQFSPHNESSITKHYLIYSEGSFTMHDLMNDLAKFVSGDFCFRLEDDHDEDSVNMMSKTRHISYMKRGNHGFEFDALYKSKSLHTFLSFPENPQYQYRFEMPKVLYHLLPTLQYLRLLNLSQYYVKELPSSIGNLKHLRHLDLSYSSIERLPDTLCTLYNMQTLLFGNCRALVQLPAKLGRLIKLRHLDISNRWGSTSIKKLPQNIGKWKDLQLLSNFVVAKDTGHSIVELKKLEHLHQTLCISGLDHIFSEGDALEANLRGKRYLIGLVLKWGGDTESSEKDREVLEKLQPHTNLKELKIEFYGGTRFPNWVGDHSFSNLASITIRKCKFCLFLPPLGQLPSLVKLDIEGLNEVVSIDLEFYVSSTCGIKPFRSLKYLRFKDMLEWQKWCYVGGNQEGGIFPSLCRLHLRNCPKLTKILPLDNLPKLEEVSLLGLISFGGSFSQELQCPKFLSLSELVVRNCPNFVCFPDEGMDAPILKSMHIVNCVKFRSLPEGMHILLPSLEYLHIDSCPELESFPEGGLPPALKSLDFGCNKKLYASSKQWGLERLNSLVGLSIIFEECEDIVDSFPEEGLLPTTLTHLHLSNHLNLTMLDGKELLHLKSLKRLIISNCPKLKCFPEGLPTALSRLEIAKCPLLEQRCEREKGEDWPKISHIPSIYICD